MGQYPCTDEAVQPDQSVSYRPLEPFHSPRHYNPEPFSPKIPARVGLDCMQALALAGSGW